MSSPFLRKESGCFSFLHNYVIIIPHLWWGVKFFFKKCVASFWELDIAKSRYRSPPTEEGGNRSSRLPNIPLIIL